jgi:hypothetical protein
MPLRSSEQEPKVPTYDTKKMVNNITVGKDYGFYMRVKILT